MKTLNKITIILVLTLVAILGYCTKSPVLMASTLPFLFLIGATENK